VDEGRVGRIFKSGQFDFVFHLAAQISVADSVKDPLHDLAVNAGGSFNIFKAAKDYGVKKLVFISTGGALYGDVTEPAREEMAVKPVSPYAIHKFTAERYLELFRNEYGLDAIVLRLANVYGPRQFKGGEGAAVAVFTHNAANGLASTIYGDGTKTRDYIFVGDVVAACEKAILSRFNGVLNIGTGKRISVSELLAMIAKVSGRKLEHVNAKDRPGEVQDSILDITKAKKVLGWRPKVSLKQGIGITLAWVKN
jgi:UDP-glucose 4-epimerase